MEKITVALPKGRMADESIKIFKKVNLSNLEEQINTRKLVIEDRIFNFILVKPSDVPTYVEHGAADIGICGKDILVESSKDVYELLDLKFGACKMVVAGFKDHQIQYSIKRVATKFPNVARNFFAQKGESVNIIYLNGSVELAPIVGLADYIVDIVETGRTLKENGLVVLEEIFRSSARLVVCKASLKTKTSQIKELYDTLKKFVESQNCEVNSK